MVYSILIILFVLCITSVIGYLLSVWYLRYGPQEGSLTFGQEDVPIRTKIPNWRNQLGYIDLITVVNYVRKYFKKSTKYNSKKIIQKVDFVFVDELNRTALNLPSGKACGLVGRVFCYNTLGYRYAILINTKSVYERRLTSEQFAGLLLHEYKHVWIHEKYGEADPLETRPEWRE